MNFIAEKPFRKEYLHISRCKKDLNFILRMLLFSHSRLIFKYTLIELLITIAIIMILSGLFLPALKKARDKTIQITCTNQMKQVMICNFNYVNDYNDYVAPAAILSQPEGNNRYYDFLYLYGKQIFTARKKDGVYTGGWPNTAPYCHSYKWGTTEAVAMELGVSYYGGYGVNIELGYNNGSDWVYSMKRISSCKNSSKLPYLCEMKWYLIYSIRWPPWVLYNHSGRTNVAFLDGHVNSFGMSTPSSEFSWSP